MLKTMKRPKTLAFQPAPIAWLSARLPVGGRVVTAIVRLWRTRDAGRCQLCRDCTAKGNFGDHLPFKVCLIAVDGLVEPDKVPLFATRGLARVDDGTGNADGEAGRETAALRPFVGDGKAVGEDRDRLAQRRPRSLTRLMRGPPISPACAAASAPHPGARGRRRRSGLAGTIPGRRDQESFHARVV